MDNFPTQARAVKETREEIVAAEDAAEAAAEAMHIAEKALDELELPELLPAQLPKGLTIACCSVD